MKKIGYRNENCYGSGNRGAKDIIIYEVTELGNTDILEYCMSNYKLSPQLNDMISAVNDQIEDGDELDTEMFCHVVDLLLKEISIQTGVTVKYALWLADKNTVLKLYDGDDGMDAYYCSDVILSDLGEDGVLYGYSTNPQPIIKKFNEFHTNYEK